MTINDYLDKIIGWKEEELVDVPFKKIPNKTKPTVEAESMQVMAIRISVTARVSTSNLIQLRNLEKNLDYKVLKNPVTNKQANVWIDKMEVKWRKQEDQDYPWLVNLEMIMEGPASDGWSGWLSPSYEYIVNGGFEYGNFTGWTCTDGEVTSTNPHTGNYCAKIYPSGQRTLAQTLSDYPATSDITTFEFYYRNPNTSNSASVIIGYTDNSSTTVSLDNGVSEWTKVNLIPYLEANKNVCRITFQNGYIDHLYIDDVSLIAPQP